MVRGHINNQNIKIMKRNVIVFAAVGALALGGFAIAGSESGPCAAGKGWQGRGFSKFALERLTKNLELNADQQARVQPIIEQAKPQLVAIHEEAMQKAKTVVDGAIEQMRPILTADQLQKLEDLRKARLEMRDARKKFHDAVGE
jgi:Spy/CpxP family protein refolding chaperone